MVSRSSRLCKSLDDNFLLHTDESVSKIINSNLVHQNCAQTSLWPSQNCVHRRRTLRNSTSRSTVSSICIQNNPKSTSQTVKLDLCPLRNNIFYFRLLVNSVWKRFQNMFLTVNAIFTYAPTFKAYHRRILEELYEDNVMYLEMRAGLSPVI